jgi:hypothetical protein
MNNAMEAPVEDLDAEVGSILVVAICIDFLVGFNFNDFTKRRELRV